MKKSNILLAAAICTLSLTYILSFVKEGASKEKRENIKSALINPANAEKLTKLQFSDASGRIQLEKTGQLWLVSRQDNPLIKFPADSTKVNSFISDFSKVRSLYKVSDRLSKNNFFGLTDDSAFTIRYTYDSSFDDLIFGKQDFTLSSRYLMSGRNTTVYEISDELEKYLTSSLQFWTEPYLISRSAAGLTRSEDIQRIIIEEKGSRRTGRADSRLLELRHGGLPEQSEIKYENEDLKLMLELGDKTSYILYFYKINEDGSDGYAVRQVYATSEYWVKISAWTYNRIKEITL